MFNRGWAWIVKPSFLHKVTAEQDQLITMNSGEKMADRVWLCVAHDSITRYWLKIGHGWWADSHRWATLFVACSHTTTRGARSTIYYTTCSSLSLCVAHHSLLNIYIYSRPDYYVLIHFRILKAFRYSHTGCLLTLWTFFIGLFLG